MKILIAQPDGEVRRQFFPEDQIPFLADCGSLEWNQLGRHYTAEEWASALGDVDICITGWGCQRFEASVLERAPKLGLVVHTGASVGTLVSEALYDRGVRVISANSLFAESVAEGVLAYILCGLRNLVFFAQEVQAGRWREETYPARGLQAKTLGLVGFGAIARELVKLLKPFPVKILVSDPYVTPEICQQFGVESVDLDSLIRRSQVLSLHAPQIPETHHLLNQDRLRQIPDGTLLINTSRGSLVDEAALAAELATGRFQAILDVYDEEPLPLDSPLRGLPNALLFPHSAGACDHRSTVLQPLIEDIRRWQRGESLRFEIPRTYGLRMTQ